MSGLLIDGKLYDVPGVEVISPGQEPWAKLDQRDFRVRPTSWVRQIIIHTQNTGVCHQAPPASAKASCSACRSACLFVGLLPLRVGFCQTQSQVGLMASQAFDLIAKAFHADRERRSEKAFTRIRERCDYIDAAAVEAALRPPGPRLRVLVTSGGTAEPIDRVRMLIVGTTAMGISVVAIAFAGDFTMLLVLFMLMGAGEAIVWGV